MPDTQHSQAEMSNRQAFLSLREAKGTDEVTSRVTLLAELRLGEGSTEIDNLQSETSNSEKLPLPTGEGWGEGSTFNSVTIEQLLEPNNVTFNCHSENLEKLNEFTSSNFSNYSESSHRQAIMTSETQNDHCEISPVARFRNKFGMTSDFCRLTQGRIYKQRKAAFTLAEVLITLGIIGVVAALTLPALLTNIQSKVRAERSRSVQYKFSLATEKMARLNLIGPYDSTDAFVDELQKHLKISKR